MTARLMGVLAFQPGMGTYAASVTATNGRSDVAAATIVKVQGEPASRGKGLLASFTIPNLQKGQETVILAQLENSEVSLSIS